MSSRLEILEATLDLVEEGIVVLDEQSNVLFWNRAAAALTGYCGEEVVCRHIPEDLYQVDRAHRDRMGATTETDANAEANEGDVPHPEDELLERPTLVSMRHKQGHALPGMLRRVALRDPLGDLTGAVLLFYPVEEAGTLAHGETAEGAGIERSQADMEDRLDAAQHQWLTNRVPLGLLWITVDQAKSLRKTHGREACESMLRTVEQTLLRQMKPAEIIGRWGDDEFLVLAHERTAELLAEHAKRLAGQARTADFRWWGDRVGLTVSIGASQANGQDTLQSLLLRTRRAMQTSAYAGGNHVTEARGEQCSQS